MRLQVRNMIALNPKGVQVLLDRLSASAETAPKGPAPPDGQAPMDVTFDIKSGGLLSDQGNTRRFWNRLLSKAEPNVERILDAGPNSPLSPHGKAALLWRWKWDPQFRQRMEEHNSNPMEAWRTRPVVNEQTIRYVIADSAGCLYEDPKWVPKPFSAPMSGQALSREERERCGLEFLRVRIPGVGTEQATRSQMMGFSFKEAAKKAGVQLQRSLSVGPPRAPADIFPKPQGPPKRQRSRGPADSGAQRPAKAARRGPFTNPFTGTERDWKGDRNEGRGSDQPPWRAAAAPIPAPTAAPPTAEPPWHPTGGASSSADHAPLPVGPVAQPAAAPAQRQRWVDERLRWTCDVCQASYMRRSLEEQGYCFKHGRPWYCRRMYAPGKRDDPMPCATWNSGWEEHCSRCRAHWLRGTAPGVDPWAITDPWQSP